MNVSVAQENLAVKRRLHPRNRPKQCGFASSIGAEKACEFAGSQREINIAGNDGSRPVWTGITHGKIMQIEN